MNLNKIIDIDNRQRRMGSQWIWNPEEESQREVIELILKTLIHIKKKKINGLKLYVKRALH